MTRLVDAWERFWFTPEQTSTLALVRIFYGFIVLCWSVSMTHDAFDFFSSDGILPRQLDYGALGAHGLWSVLGASPGKTAIVVLFVALIAGAICLMVGFYTRVAALIVFVCLISLERRNLFILNSGDGLLKTIAFFLVLAPSGASLSLDRLRTARDRFWEFPLRSPWVIRLMQVQFSVVYLSTVWAKVRGVTWNDGTAVSFSLRIEDLARLHVPNALVTSPIFSNVMTYGTLAIELSLGVLVWNRKLRPWVLAAGVFLHLSIDLTLRVGFFSYAILTLYVAFIPPEAASARLLALRDRFSARRARRERRAAPASGR